MLLDASASFPPLVRFFGDAFEFLAVALHVHELALFAYVLARIYEWRRQALESAHARVLFAAN